MKTINNFRYSRDSFDDYEWRLMFDVMTNDYKEHKLTMYTDNPDYNGAIQVIDGLKTKKVISFVLEHKASKEQDDRSAELINDWLKDM